MGYVRLTSDEWEKPPFEFKVATGYGGRFGGVHKFGYNPAVGLSFEDVWSVGGGLSYLTSAETMNIASTSASDGVAGTGALTILVIGVDANYNEIEETVTMNGVANVLTTNSFLRIYRMYNVTVGSNGINVGNITATASAAATVQAQIDADVGQTLMALATVPDGFSAIITGLNVAATGLDTALIDLMTREEGEGWRVRHRDSIPTASIANAPFMPFRVPIIVSEHTDIRIRAIKASGGGTTIVTGNFSYYLIDSREVRT